MSNWYSAYTGSCDVTVSFFKFVNFEYGCQDNLCWLSETYSAPSPSISEMLLQGNMVPGFTVRVKVRVNWKVFSFFQVTHLLSARLRLSRVILSQRLPGNATEINQDKND